MTDTTSPALLDVRPAALPKASATRATPKARIVWLRAEPLRIAALVVLGLLGLGAIALSADAPAETRRQLLIALAILLLALGFRLAEGPHQPAHSTRPPRSR